MHPEIKEEILFNDDGPRSTGVHPKRNQIKISSKSNIKELSEEMPKVEIPHALTKIQSEWTKRLGGKRLSMNLISHKGHNIRGMAHHSRFHQI